MANQNLYDIAELYELDRYEDVNKYLEIGWILLSTHIKDFGDPDFRQQKTVYCLGWPRSLGDPKSPEWSNL
jgi:hypothetical protein